ncbi:MAG: thioredoxin domain-containing protein [Gemmatimonadales bacterium]
MPRSRVNFGAAVATILVVCACSPAGSPPRTASESSAPASPKPAASTPDPVIAAADHGRIDGDSAAKTWVIIASDFQCPFCRQWHHESYRQFVDEYVRSGKVNVAYLNFPLAQHQNAVPTAQAAMCASAQNKFWQYHDALFESQDKWSSMQQPRPVLDSIARTVAVDFPEWAKCVDSDRMLPLIFADRDRAAGAGVKSTPSFLVGGQVIEGAQPLSDMRPIIDAAIAKSGGASPR